MADHQQASLTVPSEPASVGEARRFTGSVLAAWGMPDGAEALYTLQLIVSELTTNAVQHTGGRSPLLTVSLHLYEDAELCVGVTDGDPRAPRRLPAAVRQDNGRGLVIVRSLAAASAGRLYVTPTDEGGKTVWVALPWAQPPVATG